MVVHWKNITDRKIEAIAKGSIALPIKEGVPLIWFTAKGIRESHA